MEDEIADVPEGTLPVTQDMLKAAILQNVNQAWSMLKQNPVAVVALSKVKRDLLEDENLKENPNVVLFFEELETNLIKISDFTNLTEEFGISLTTELITELWRREIQDYHISSVNKFFLDGLQKLNEEAEFLENTPSNSVVREMINYSLRRILDFEEYEKSKTRQHLSEIELEINNFLNTIFSEKIENTIPDNWKAWLYIGTGSTISLAMFRDKIAEIMLSKLIEIFETLTEDMKFEIAPFIQSFDMLLQHNEEEQDT